MKPSLRYVVGIFSCVIWTSLDPYRIDLDRFDKKSTLYKKYMFYMKKPYKTAKATFAGHKSSSYSSYEDDIDTNRILIQKSTILKRQTIKISRLR